VRRRFIVVAQTTEEMMASLHVLARCVSAALMISHGLRPDTDLLFHSLRDGFTVHFVTQRLRCVRPDEASILGILSKAYRAASTMGGAPRSVHHGVIVCRRDLRSYTTQFQHKLLCGPCGLDLRQLPPRCSSMLFVVPLGDRVEVEVEGVERLKVPSDLMPDQVISLINVYLDRTWGVVYGWRGAPEVS